MSARFVPALCLLAAVAGCRAKTNAIAPPPNTEHRTPNTEHPLFHDAAAHAGITFALGHGGRSPLTILETLGHGAAFVDIDGDGWLDIVLVGKDRAAVYHNNRDGTFSDVTARSGLKQAGWWQGIATGDYDNDGREDLFLSGYRCCALYHNEGGGRFRDVTREVGLDSKLWGTSAAFVDIDNDGHLDLFVAHYVAFTPSSVQFCNFQGVPSTCGPTTYEPEKPTLYHNDGHGHFADETAKRGITSANGNALGVACADYDGDGWTDIAVANDQLPGDLFHNKGHGYFENVASVVGTAYDSQGAAHAGMGLDWADVGRDGGLALVVTTYQHQATSLYAQTTPGLFADVCYSAGIAQPTVNYVGFGVKFFDYDNDGLPDLAIANGHAVDTIAKTDRTTTYPQPTQLFHNVGGKFEDVSARAGPDFARPIVGRALAAGDYDNDGRVDLLVVDLEGRPLLLHNDAPNAGHWLSVRLRGSRCNRDGIGAVLTITAGGRTWKQVVSTDGSFMAASDVRAHVGLGTARQADRIEVRWPGGARTALTNVAADRFITVEDWRGIVAALPGRGMGGAK